MIYFPLKHKLKFIHLLVLIVIPSIVWAQTSTVDSLRIVIATQENDTNKVNSLLQIANASIVLDLEKSFQYSREALHLSEKLNFHHGMAKSLYQLGLYYMKYKNKLDSAVQYADRAIYISDSLHFLRILMNSYRLKINYWGHKQDVTKMKYFILKCLDISRKLNDSVSIGKAFGNFGRIAFKQGNYDSASIWYMKAIDIFEKSGNEGILGIAYINLAKNYIHINDYSNAEKYLLRALDIEDEKWRMTYISLVYDNLGIIYSEDGEYAKAIEFYDKGIEQALKTDLASEYAHLLINKSHVLRKQGLFSEGIESLRKALQISRENGFIKMEENALSALASNYADQKMFRKAIDYYDSSLNVRKDFRPSRHILVIYNNVYKLYDSLGDYRNAYIYHLKYRQVKDTIHNIERLKTIDDLEIKYRNKEKEAKILSLENENLRKETELRKRTFQRDISTLAGIAIIIFALLLFAYFRQRIRKNKIITEQQIRQLEKEKKLLATRSLVEGQEEERKRIAKDLHDGIGVLLSTAKMQFTALKDQNPDNSSLINKAGKLLEQASVDVRRISHNMMPGLLTKFGLNEAVEDLFEQLYDIPGLSAKVDIDEEAKRLVENQEIMVYRIIQELVNNTLKHAKAKNISLVLNYTKDKLKIQYADDGIGFRVDKKPDSISIGMKGIESRVSFLNGELNIESDKGKGLQCTIVVPVDYR